MRKKGLRKEIQQTVDISPTLVVPVPLSCAACRARKVEGRCCLFFLRGSQIAALLSGCLEVPRRLASSVHIMPFSMSKAYRHTCTCFKRGMHQINFFLQSNLRSPPSKLKWTIFGLFDASLPAHNTSTHPTHPFQSQAAPTHGRTRQREA